MVKKIIASILFMLTFTLGVFAGISNAQTNDIRVVSVDVVGAESVDVANVRTDYNNKFTKYVYKNSDGSSTTKYEAHCASVNGVFNTCGSWCLEGEACVAVCAYTCDNVPVSGSSEAVFKIKDEENKIEVEYKTAESEYKIKYSGKEEYNIETELEIKNVLNGEIKVETSDGSVESVKVFPDEAVKKAFNAEVEDVKIKLEEKEYNNIPAVVYKVNADAEGKFLGIFKIRARYEAFVDSDTGNVLEWNGPWWAFLIKGEPSKPIVKEKVKEEDNSGVNSGAGFGGEGRLNVVREGDITRTRDTNPEECASVGGTMRTETIGVTGPVMSYCDWSGVSDAEEKCISINGVWSMAANRGVCSIIVKKTDSDDKYNVIDFNSCVAAGYPIMESYPRQCMYKDFRFVEII